jgi:hypothetical protein
MKKVLKLNSSLVTDLILKMKKNNYEAFKLQSSVPTSKCLEACIPAFWTISFLRISR